MSARVSYLTLVRRGWTKEGLAKRVEEALDPFPPADVISIGYMDQPLYLLGRRNSALITIRVGRDPGEPPDGA